MTKLPRITPKQMLRILKRDGWIEVHQEGSHIQLRHPEKAGRVTVAFHGADLSPKTLIRIIEQAGIDRERLKELL